ncbi:MAG: DUF1353 domain-containing protein [Salinisphaeraceae bacterium]
MFLTHLHLRSQPSGRWRVTRPLIYRSHDGEEITVEVDYSTDLFSVPRLLWWLFPRDGRGRACSVVHDYIYTHLTHRFTRAEADRIFRQALADKDHEYQRLPRRERDNPILDRLAAVIRPLAPILHWLRRWTMWAGVRVGGRGNW